MGITRDEVTKEIKDFEWILDPNVTSGEFYQHCSVVCIDKGMNDEVIACYMGYCLDEQEFEESYPENPRRYLQLENQPESVRSYAKSMFQNNYGLDIFQRYDLKKVLYGESWVIAPKYRNTIMAGNVRLIMKMYEHSMNLAGEDVGAFLSETQIPPEDWHGREERFKKRPANEIILRENINNGFLCLLILRFPKKL